MKKSNLYVGKKLYSTLLAVSFIAALLFTSCTKEDVTTTSLPSDQQVSSRVADNLQLTGPGTTTPTMPSGSIIYISHGQYASLPVYSVAVSEMGNVTYTGFNNVKTKGIVTFHISPIMVDKLRDILITNGFMQLNNYYPYSATASKTVTGFRADENQKIVVDYGVAVPSQLTTMRHLIEFTLGP